ncbi:hypothetical protein D1159_00090 [Pseudoflavonifractor sp. 524-17]|uniref:hypothetical protein n=1 Tax=Pseudoflavonifractor sp. 524-17 TaxID=2304577 RepID=UPI00192A5D41|nr:hypothetical protein [Pseudoflavonifractor sp. 524-17]NCE63012.1 hypothetical protein [Pseudoflavonifractor sp. 524-17]
MPNIAKKAILRAKVAGVLTDLMVQTNAENVRVDGTTLSAKLAELLAAVETRPTGEDMDTAISQAISGLINGAPETYDTLKEIADYISTHQEAADALNAAIGGKADAADLTAAVARIAALEAKKVAEADLADDLKAKVNAAAQGNHSHENKTVLDGITAEKTAAWDGKSKIHYAAAEPADLAEGDLWVQLTEG